MQDTGSTRIDAAGSESCQAVITYRVQVLSREQDGAQLRRVRVEGGAKAKHEVCVNTTSVAVLHEQPARMSRA
ncbi:MAG: hypothetical protein JWM45_4224 [Pseudonocardiales bacterium]|nr:hypothetical protein [Pseudonocardiales bacterium]